MADVFISYAREDRERAQSIAHALEQRGWSVWWDREIPVGGSFAEVIERELMTARCVVVLWSKKSLKSPWVQNEAREGLVRHVLVPATIEAVQPPLEFRHLQTAALQDWEPGSDDAELETLVRAVQRFTQVQGAYGGVPLGTATRPPEYSAQPSPIAAKVVLVGAVIVALVVLLVIVYFLSTREPETTVVDTAGTPPAIDTGTTTGTQQTETQPNDTQPNDTQPNDTQPNDTQPNDTLPSQKEPEFTGVGKLLVNGQHTCTAFLIKATQAVTAKECVKRDATMTLALRGQGLSPTTHVVRPAASSPAVRSYALLDLNSPANPGFEPLKLSRRPPQMADEVFIGDPESTKRARLASVSNTELLYAATIGSVSMGAPVIAVSDGSVVGVHIGRSRTSQYKRAVRLTTTLIRVPTKRP